MIESDCGSNYKGAQQIMKENYDERDLADIKWSEIRSKLKSHGIQLVTRGAKMPWVMGGAESANKMVNRDLPTNKRMTLFQTTYFMEYAMFVIHSCPIGLSTSYEAVCPIDINLT